MSDFFNNCFYLSLLLTNPFETKKISRQQGYRPISIIFYPPAPSLYRIPMQLKTIHIFYLQKLSALRQAVGVSLKAKHR